MIDTQTAKKVADIEVGQAPAQVAFPPDGRFVYAPLNGEDAVAKVDTRSRKLVSKLPVGDGPIQTYVSCDNRYLPVANQGTEEKRATTVSVVDTKIFTVAATVDPHFTGGRASTRRTSPPTSAASYRRSSRRRSGRGHGPSRQGQPRCLGRTSGPSGH